MKKLLEAALKNALSNGWYLHARYLRLEIEKLTES